MTEEKRVAAECKMLGVKVNPLTVEEVLRIVEGAVGRERPCVVGNHNLHSVYFYHRHSGMRAFYDNAEWVFIDSMVLVAIARVFGFFVDRGHRITPLDWYGALFNLCENKGLKVYYLGSSPYTVKRGAEVLLERFPNLKLEFHHGYFDVRKEAQVNRDVVGKINAFRPDVLIVGMGMPRQEQWIVENEADLQAGVVMNWGATIDYIAGAIATPPRWTGRLGLEWLYRLVTSPQRVWRRYLVEPWFLIGLFMRDLKEVRLRRRFRASQSKERRDDGAGGGWS